MARERSRRLARRALAADAASRQAGLLTTFQIRALGVTDNELRAELSAGRWETVRNRTVRVATPAHAESTLWWEALLACSPRAVAAGSCTAALGGSTALLAAGLVGIGGDGLVHIAAPKSSRPLPAPRGVRIHETRRWRAQDVVTEPIPRVRTPMAAVQAALWARSDREAALMFVAPVQQRLTTAQAIGAALDIVRRDRRRALLRAVVGELVDGVRSLNELDFAALCRARGLPEPSRQVVLRTPQRRAYLDVRWDRWHVVVEIDGIGHLQLDRWLDDTTRHNEVALTGDVVLRCPSLAIRIDPSPYLDQVERALRRAGWRP